MDAKHGYGGIFMGLEYLGILVSYPGLRTNPRWLPREDYINKRKYICNILHLMAGGVEMPSPIVATIPRATEIKNKFK